MHWPAYALMLSVSFAARSSCECLPRMRAIMSSALSEERSSPCSLFAPPYFVLHSRFPGGFAQMQSARATTKKNHNHTCLHGCDGLRVRAFHGQLREAVGDGAAHAVTVNACPPAIFSELAFSQLQRVRSIKEVAPNIAACDLRLLSWRQINACRRCEGRKKESQHFLIPFELSLRLGQCILRNH